MAAAPKLRFLVVDPLEGVQVFSRRLLESYGFDTALIRCCADTATALQMAREQAPDFLITDWFAKAEPSGAQLFAELRKLNPACQGGFTSFQVDESVSEAARTAGTRFLLKKPFSADDLKRELQQAFEALAKNHPELMARVSAETRGRLDPRVARHIQLPPVPPPLRAGEHVRFDGQRRKVTAVVIRGGEQVAQLEGLKDMVPAHRLSR